jgi:hypothetical protein
MRIWHWILLLLALAATTEFASGAKQNPGRAEIMLRQSNIHSALTKGRRPGKRARDPTTVDTIAQEGVEYFSVEDVCSFISGMKSQLGQDTDIYVEKFR